MNFLEIEPGIWIAPELVCAVKGCAGEYVIHWVEIQFIGGNVTKCSEHGSPYMYAHWNTLDCYKELIKDPNWGKTYTVEKALEIANSHAREIQARIAEYRDETIHFIEYENNDR